jgi:arsenate reductase (thioredoxin)
VTITFHPTLAQTIEEMVHDFDSITAERRALLDELTSYIRQKTKTSSNINLVFICTHNSRRSHISQIWAQTAAAYYGIENVFSFSGGTEATAFNPRAVSAIRKAGFEVPQPSRDENPVYEIRFANEAPPIVAFSKRYDAEYNPKNSFAAIMTCTDADENCPIIPGAETRIPLSYNDPKEADGTPHEAQRYEERVREIGTELFYAFSRV